MIICYAVEPINRNNKKGIYNNGRRNAMVQPQHPHMVPFIIIIIITIIWKGYFSVNSILRFGSLSRIFINKVLLINNELSFLPQVLKSYK